MKLKPDDAHRLYVAKQSQKLTERLVNAVEAAVKSTPNVNGPQLPVLEGPVVHLNDVDYDDMPSTRAMSIDTADSDSDLDVEGSIVSEEE